MPPVNGSTLNLALSSYYWIEIDSLGLAFLKSVSGLSIETEIKSEKISGSDGKALSQKLAGKLSYPDVTITRSLSNDKSLWDWWAMVQDGHYPTMRKNGSITIADSGLTPIAVFEITNAWPTSYKLSDFDSSSSEGATEELVLAVEEIKRAS